MMFRCDYSPSSLHHILHPSVPIDTRSMIVINDDEIETSEEVTESRRTSGTPPPSHDRSNELSVVGNDGYRSRARTQVFETAPAISGPLVTVHKTRREELMSQFEDAQAKLRRLQLFTSNNSRKKTQKKTATLTRKDANVTEILSQELEESYEELAKNEENLKLASELGQQLVSTVEEQTQLLNAMEEDARQQQQQSQIVRGERNKARKDLQRAQVMIEEVSAQSDEHKRARESLHEQVLKLQTSVKEAEENGKAQLKAVQNELRELLKKNTIISEENRTLHDQMNNFTTEKVTRINNEMAQSLALEWQNRVHSLEHALQEQKDEVAKLRRANEGLAANAVAAETRLSPSKSSFSSNNLHNNNNNISGGNGRDTRARSIPVVANYEDYNKYRLTSVPAEIPPEALVIRMMNVFNAIMVIVVGIAVLVGSVHVDVPTLVCIALVVIGLTWLSFEGHPSRFEQVLQRNVPFFYNITGRVVFHLIVILLVAGMSNVGIAVSVYTGAVLAGNAYVLYTFPDLQDRHLKLSMLVRSKSNVSLLRESMNDHMQPLLHDTGDDSGPLLPAFGGVESDSMLQHTSTIQNERRRNTSDDKYRVFIQDTPTTASGHLQDALSDPNWVETLDDTTGRTYYLNTKTGETTFALTNNK